MPGRSRMWPCCLLGFTGRRSVEGHPMVPPLQWSRRSMHAACKVRKKKMHGEAIKHGSELIIRGVLRCL